MILKEWSLETLFWAQSTRWLRPISWLKRMKSHPCSHYLVVSLALVWLSPRTQEAITSNWWGLVSCTMLAVATGQHLWKTVRPRQSESWLASQESNPKTSSIAKTRLRNGMGKTVATKEAKQWESSHRFNLNLSKLSSNPLALSRRWARTSLTRWKLARLLMSAWSVVWTMVCSTARSLGKVSQTVVKNTLSTLWFCPSLSKSIPVP